MFQLVITPLIQVSELLTTETFWTITVLEQVEYIVLPWIYKISKDYKKSILMKFKLNHNNAFISDTVEDSHSTHTLIIPDCHWILKLKSRWMATLASSVGNFGLEAWERTQVEMEMSNFSWALVCCCVCFVGFCWDTGLKLQN